MASNLNKAFMRAYAKDSGRTVPDPAALPENTHAATATTSHQQPARQPIAAAAATPAQSTPSQSQPAKPMSVAAPHFSNQTVASPQRSSAQFAPKNAPTAPAQPAAAAEAANVWQRIDAAQSNQPPHMVNRPSRPTATPVGVSATSGPKWMYAGASAPAVSPTRTAESREPQPAELPLLPEEPNASSTDSQAVETRRRTVADFLYSAGKISGAATSPVRQVAPSATSPAAAFRPLGRPAGGAAEPNTTRVHTATAERSTAAVASAAHSTLYAASSAQAPPQVYAPVHPPTKQPELDGLPASVQPPSTRTGQILRVDVPSHARGSDTALERPTSPSYQPSESAMLDEAADMGLSGMYGTVELAREQQRVDRGDEVSEAEQKLWRSKHKVFNPVWEVDTLQWPGVCDKLMEHRAESMAQVAAHLKAACQDGLNILGVTSPTSGEGRTTVACCLARLAASHGLNVVLVDLDLDHPTLCLQTNLEVEQDWRDCLDGDIALEEVAVHSIDDQLTLLPLKDRSDRPELLASDMGIADMLRELSESFELVIVDACRMDSSGNVICGLASAQIFDAAIVVVDRRNSHQERIEDAVRALQQTGVGSIGIVDNFSM